jgi:hypothetical protein
MLTYLSVDETLIMWCVVSGVVGFWFGVIVNGLKRHEDPRVDTIVYACPRDAYDYGKEWVPGE